MTGSPSALVERRQVNVVDTVLREAEDVHGEVHAEPPSALPQQGCSSEAKGDSKSSCRCSGTAHAGLLGDHRVELGDRMTAKKRFKRLVRRRAAKTGESYTAALRHLRATQREEPTMTVKNSGANCSFCGKHNSEVKKIVAGPGVYICNECVGLCNEVIAQVEEQPDSVRRSSGPAPDRLLEWLPSIANTLRSVEADIARKVGRLRQQGVGWNRISEALGMSESEATQRFSAPPEP